MMAVWIPLPSNHWLASEKSNANVAAIVLRPVTNGKPVETGNCFSSIHIYINIIVQIFWKYTEKQEDTNSICILINAHKYSHTPWRVFPFSQAGNRKGKHRFLWKNGWRACWSLCACVCTGSMCEFMFQLHLSSHWFVSASFVDSTCGHWNRPWTLELTHLHPANGS